jgi:hypothetical protein
MGADLIVFIAKGPAKFTKLNIKKAKRHALKIQEAAKEINALLDSDPDERSVSVATKTEALYESPLFDGLQSQRGWDSAIEAESGIRLMAEEDLDKFIEEFIEWWRGCGGRDTAGRSDPHDKKFVIRVCGEMSWGDSPSGYGYSILDKAYWFDIPQSLGIL